jgi:hypothetical protein
VKGRRDAISFVCVTTASEAPSPASAFAWRIKLPGALEGADLAARCGLDGRRGFALEPRI